MLCEDKLNRTTCIRCFCDVWMAMYKIPAIQIAVAYYPIRRSQAKLEIYATIERISI